ncbi:MAG: hydrogen gas-evolving membrane-bound hydrogenase subunit E [Actinomycetes bacterium]
MLAVLVLHAVLAAATAALARRLGPKVFLLAALAPLSGVVLIVAAAPQVLAGEALTTEVPWIPGLDLSVALRLDGLSLLMLVLVSGVGFAIFVFTAWYAHRDATLTRFVWSLTAFAGAMVGLVVADDVILLYVFWELTTITSYLLVGLQDDEEESRAAAMQALLVTVVGGLAMLVGLVVLAQQAGTTRISQIVADPPSGALVPVALALVLVGALTKSAQVPFHPWLPAAMAAPTPVSAYLHAAAMVKAGVYLVARLSPGFAPEHEWWRPTLLAFGVATMVLGGWRALREHDLKRLLAFSTVSQLGFLMAVAGWGTAESGVAVTALLLAHGFAKSALFLSLGAVDHQAHTRDLRELSGLWRRMPLLAAAAGAAALSLGGVPFLLGFIAKEEALAAVAHAGGTAGALALAGFVLGSTLTLAYSLRYWWGAFGSEPGVQPLDVPAPSGGMTLPVASLSAVSLGLGLLPWLADDLATAVASAYREAEPAHLVLWHGVNLELGLSMAALAAGATLFALRRRTHAVQEAFARAVPASLDADRGFTVAVARTDRLADLVTGRTQSGSLPVYLGVIVAAATLLPGAALLSGGLDLSGTVLVDVPAQVAVGVLVCAVAVLTTIARTRLTAVLLLGAVGYGVALLYVLQGGPDLALTQFLVETLSVVIFLLVLRLLPRRFPRRVHRRSQALRALVACAIGLFVTLATLVATSVRTRPSVAVEHLARSEPEANGKNVVNVILVDFRGLDTFGEVTVVLTAALGIAALVLTARRPRVERAVEAGEPEPRGVEVRR